LTLECPYASQLISASSLLLHLGSFAAGGHLNIQKVFAYPKAFTFIKLLQMSGHGSSWMRMTRFGSKWLE